MAKLILGCGYLGRRVAQVWRADGETVYAVTRTASRAAELEAAGVRPILGEVTEARSLRQLPTATTVLYAIGYDRRAGMAMRQVYVDGLRNALAALPESIDRILYISSTSVYGQSDGGWVDESSPCQPARENGRICLEAETMLRRHRYGSRAVILRLAGLYGPGRIPRRHALLTGEPIAAPRVGWLNLIHVDDAARIVLAAENVSPPQLYTVGDGHPPQRHEYYEELARLLQASPPKFIEPPPDSPAAMRAESNKRVSNRRMLAELQIALQYPSYREGLAAIVTAEMNSKGNTSR